MTLMNAEPAESGPTRPWPTARSAASRSLLRAGIAPGAAGLFLVLICGLAYADAGASLSVDVVPSGPAPNATCQLGNHGPVRGWAHVANGTLVADDGCLLQMGYPNVNFGFGPFALADMQNMRDNGHYNALRDSIFLGSWYNDTVAGKTITDIESQLDADVATTQQLGLYLIVDNHNTLPSPNNQGCPDWSADTTIWTAIAPRYANATNVIYQIQNEPDWCSVENYSDIASNEDRLYQLIRAAAPNTPILAWTFLNPSWVFGASGALHGVLSQAPHINYSNATVDFHDYSGGDTNFISTARSYPAPVTMSEYGICTGSSWNTILSTLVSLGVSWSCGDGYPDNNPGFVVTWPKD
jgi:Cellulase (glycosyl hydrolase family 5)